MSEAPLDLAAAPVPTPSDMPTQLPDTAATQGEEPKPEHSQEELDELLKKLRSENHELRTKLRKSEPLARKAQEAEEATKTEVQKALDRAQEAINEKTELQAGYDRLELAVQYHLPREDIDLIGSGSREEMESRAQRLAAKNAAAVKAERPPTDRPVEGLRPGATPQPPQPADDSYPAEWQPTWMRGGDKESSIFHGQ